MYAPGATVHIATARHGIVDATEDLVSGSLTLTENQLGNVSLRIMNHRRKYDGVFTPNDRISIQLKRVGPYLQVLSGYLNQVPFFSIYPRTIVLTASCTL